MTKKLTIREEANAIVCWVFRNGFLEELHAGKHSDLLEHPELSRITDKEMKRLMIECCENMAEVLRLREKDSESYDKQLVFFHNYTKKWEK